MKHFLSRKKILFICLYLTTLLFTDSCSLFNSKEPLEESPKVITGAASNVRLTTAQLNGAVNPKGLETAYYFEWGTATNYENTTEVVSAGSGTDSVSVNMVISGLTSGETYYCRIVAKDSIDICYGDNICFTTNQIIYTGVNSSGFKEYMNTMDSMVLIKIPAGSFVMGSDSAEGDANEEPQHTVYVSQYYIGKYEVTNKQYKKFCDATERNYPADPGFDGMSNYFTGYPSHPVVQISWEDAKAYAEWTESRLPTEAEWEKAARGREDTLKYPWGFNDPYYINQYYANYNPGNYSDDGYLNTCPIGVFNAGKSPYGCYNMAGNVWEWCNDWYLGTYYSISPSTDPEGPDSGAGRVVRGGSWLDFAYYMRCASRNGISPSKDYYYLGFRIAYQ